MDTFGRNQACATEPDAYYPAFEMQWASEGRVVFLNKLVKKNLLRAMALVPRCTLTATGFPASWHPQRNRILAIRCLARIIRRQPGEKQQVEPGLPALAML